MHTAEGRLILHAKALGPAKELERIKIRNKESHERRRFTNRWVGGIAPFGYRVVKLYEDGKTAAHLELDDDMAAELRSMREQIIGGQSFVGVAKGLNARGVLTARDRARVAKGKPVKARDGEEGTPERWSETSVKRLLTDESTMGRKKHNRELIYGMDGQPIQMAEAVFTQDEWESLQAAVGKRTHTKERRVNGTSPMYAVVHCGVCGSKATHKVTQTRGVSRRYYRCGAWPKEDRCAGISCRAETIEEMVEIHFLQKFSNVRVTKRVWVPGSDSTRELTDITKRMERLRKQDEEGDWDDDQETYRFRMGQYKARKKELESQPVVLPGWEEEDQGMTFGELWPRLDLEGKRKQLIESGYKVMVGKKTFTVTPEPDSHEERQAKREALNPDEMERVETFHTARENDPFGLTPQS